MAPITGDVTEEQSCSQQRLVHRNRSKADVKASHFTWKTLEDRRYSVWIKCELSDTELKL